eukprot:GHVR01156339.1.p1 GENE.GHVR01156339.1~~GHVR01156339.1.p1  ORF type:complete len:117 (-),score=105.10 GHVR01156339.1:45-395(-)
MYTHTHTHTHTITHKMNWIYQLYKKLNPRITHTHTHTHTHTGANHLREVDDDERSFYSNEDDGESDIVVGAVEVILEVLECKTLKTNLGHTHTHTHTDEFGTHKHTHTHRDKFIRD